MFTDDVLQSFNELDYVIYNTVLRTGDKLERMQVRDLADAAHVSPASIVNVKKIRLRKWSAIGKVALIL